MKKVCIWKRWIVGWAPSCDPEKILLTKIPPSKCPYCGKLVQTGEGKP
jgi:hypothetical protein